MKLELTWIGKNDPCYDVSNIEPRILVEDKGKSYGDFNTENLLINGDNLLALKALIENYRNKVKCVFIDPPYNTGNAFEQYDDNLEHSMWLNLMKPRLEILKELLTYDGSIWISIDDDESHYLKVLCDEIFGRKNFISNVIWEKKYTVANDAKWLSDNHDHILVYAKNKEIWSPNRLPRTEKMNKAYKNPDNHPKGLWKATPLHAKSGSKKTQKFEYVFKNGIKWSPPAGTYPRFSEETLSFLDENNEIWFGKDGNAVPSRKTFLCDIKNSGIPPRTLWRYDEVGHNHEARTEVKQFNNEDVFATPKPERLIERILTIASNEGDIVLDSFLGSGTTVAVAHKMKRKWIGIEIGDHCITHCVPRLKKIIDGNDEGGITNLHNWEGGGGFKFFELAPSILEEDKFGNYEINKEYDSKMLAAAICKHEGFTYLPSEENFWKHGYSTEKDYIFVTTTFITMEYLDKIHEDMKSDESLLICCKSYKKECENKYHNITIKKIHRILYENCEFYKDDYSFNIVNINDYGDIDEE